MRYLATIARRKHDNPWEPLVSLLRETADPRPPPRKLALFQMYMMKKPEEIAAAVEERWLTTGLREEDKFAFRAQVARELLAAESSTYQADLRAELEEEHVRSTQAFEKEQDLRLHTVKTSGESQAEYVACRNRYSHASLTSCETSARVRISLWSSTHCSVSSASTLDIT